MERVVDNGHTTDGFWQQVGARVPPAGVVAVLPHTASLSILNVTSGEEREAVRGAFGAVVQTTVGQADGRLIADLQQRGYTPVDFDALRQAALASDLGDTDWSEPPVAMRIGRAVGADLVLAGDFQFEVRLLPRGDEGAPAARQEVRYTLVALDVADGSEVARSPLTHRWESTLPSAGQA